MPQSIEEYEESSISQSLTSLYDDVIYWELAKGSNQFYVTFEKGRYAIPNNKQESIGTMEITYPHVNSNTSSLNAFISSSKRIGATHDAFLMNSEKIGSLQSASHNYNGFIPITELKGSRYFQTTLTSSVFQTNTYGYDIYDGTTSHSQTKTIAASYFYPFSSHQLSVLRKSPTIIVNLDADNEIEDGIGTKGYVVIPENLHPNINKRLEFYLEAASNQINV